MTTDVHPLREALTYDDILLTPRDSAILPYEAELTTQLTAKIALRLPVISAAMDTITEAQVAIALAREGGIGIIHRNFSVEEQVREVRLVKRSAHGVVTQPITLRPTATIREALHAMKEHLVSSFPITNEAGILKGIVTNRDLRFTEDELDHNVSSIMTKDIVSVADSLSLAEARGLFKKRKIEQIIIAGKDKKLKGLLCLKDLLNEEKYPMATKDALGRLRVGAACGTGEKEFKRIHALVEAELDVLVIDTAHGHQKQVLKTLKKVKKIYPNLQVIAGNVATEDGAAALIDHGADGIKVGIGAGSICTTRVVTGVGVPQVTALMDALKAAQKHNIPIIADGGLRFSGDVVKALALGASSVMLGSMFAGTTETPGEMFFHHGNSYKSYRGMGSIAAMKKGSGERYFQKDTGEGDLIPEGIEGAVPHKGPLSATLHQIMGGLRAAMGYTGSANLKALHERALFVRTTHAGRVESHVHDVQMLKEAPNYRKETLY